MTWGRRKVKKRGGEEWGDGPELGSGPKITLSTHQDGKDPPQHLIQPQNHTLQPQNLSHRNGEDPPGHLQHGGAPEIVGEEADVDGGRHQHQLQVGPGGQQASQDPQEEIPVEVPLVDLVGDDHPVGGQRRLPLRLPQQQPLGQEDDAGGGRAAALEADLVAHLGGGRGKMGQKKRKWDLRRSPGVPVRG